MYVGALSFRNALRHNNSLAITIFMSENAANHLFDDADDLCECHSPLILSVMSRALRQMWLPESCFQASGS